MRASWQVEDNVARPSIDNFEREPGRQPGVLLLPLHSTLLPLKLKSLQRDANADNFPSSA
jgi:hypothetical protein